MLRVEAKLSKDVHFHDEALEVSIVLHQTVPEDAKKAPKIPVKKLKAQIFQSIDSTKNGEWFLPAIL